MRQDQIAVVKRLQKEYNDLITSRDHIQNTVNVSNQKLKEVLEEQDLLERTTIALQQAKPLLSASSIRQCEKLANSAISSVFGFDYTVEYNVETNRFLLNKGNFVTDLADAEGGGMVTVISFVFVVYLLVKLGKRRFLAFDEHFTQISDKYFPSFIEFVRTLCKDLNLDILLISHDQRIQPDDVDRCFIIENGKSKRVK